VKIRNSKIYESENMNINIIDSENNSVVTNNVVNSSFDKNRVNILIILIIY